MVGLPTEVRKNRPVKEWSYGLGILVGLVQFFTLSTVMPSDFLWDLWRTPIKLPPSKYAVEVSGCTDSFFTK